MSKSKTDCEELPILELLEGAWGRLHLKDQKSFIADHKHGLAESPWWVWEKLQQMSKSRYLVVTKWQVHFKFGAPQNKHYICGGVLEISARLQPQDSHY